MVDYFRYTPIWNATGHPGISVLRARSPDGLPIESPFVAGLGQEAHLLALAYELEAERPRADLHPA